MEQVRLRTVDLSPIARSRESGCVSRVFAPKMGLDEDSVTGSEHAVLAPYWCDQLGRTSLTGLQALAPCQDWWASRYTATA